MGDRVAVLKDGRLQQVLHSENGAIVHLAPQPDKLHLFSTSTQQRLTA